MRWSDQSIEDRLIILAVSRRGVDRHDVKLEVGTALELQNVESLAQHIARRPPEDQGEGLAGYDLALGFRQLADEHLGEGKGMMTASYAKHLLDMGAKMLRRQLLGHIRVFLVPARVGFMISYNT